MSKSGRFCQRGRVILNFSQIFVSGVELFWIFKIPEFGVRDPKKNPGIGRFPLRNRDFGGPKTRFFSACGRPDFPRSWDRKGGGVNHVDIPWSSSESKSLTRRVPFSRTTCIFVLVLQLCWGIQERWSHNTTQRCRNAAYACPPLCWSHSAWSGN